jgi:hypothetical protein
MEVVNRKLPCVRMSLRWEMDYETKIRVLYYCYSVAQPHDTIILIVLCVKDIIVNIFRLDTKWFIFHHAHIQILNTEISKLVYMYLVLYLYEYSIYCDICMGIRVRIGPQYTHPTIFFSFLLVLGDHVGRFSDETQKPRSIARVNIYRLGKTEAPCHSRCDTTAQRS